MLEIWESVDTILSLTTPPSVTLSFSEKALSTPGDVQRIVTDNYNWIIRNVINISNTNTKRPYQETTLPKIGFICFLDVHGNI